MRFEVENHLSPPGDHCRYLVKALTRYLNDASKMEYKRTQSGDGGHRSVSTRRTGVPLGSSFNELFSGGASVWLKIAGGAIATPVAVVVFALRSRRRGGGVLPDDPAVIAISLAACAVIGAVLGGLLSLKDVVQSRLADGTPVSFPLKLLFGFGIWSLLFVWFPVVIVLTFVVTFLTLT